jgi:hypothetical protein
VAGPQEHSAHGQVHRACAWEVQRLLAELGSTRLRSAELLLLGAWPGSLRSKRGPASRTAPHGSDAVLGDSFDSLLWSRHAEIAGNPVALAGWCRTKVAEGRERHLWGSWGSNPCGAGRPFVVMPDGTP